MRCFGIKIVAGTIQVYGKQVDRIKAVLLPVSLGLDEQHFLCESVGGIRLFGISVPEILFSERHRRELRICTNGSKGDEFQNFMSSPVLHHLSTHDQVVVEK